MDLYGTQTVNDNGHLVIGGSDAVDLAHVYGTPLVVYDTALFRKRAAGFQETFKR